MLSSQLNSKSIARIAAIQTLYQFETGMYVAFEEPQSAITEGQFVAWHLGEELVGSGVIS